MSAWLGLTLVHLAGASLLAIASPARLLGVLRSPAAAWVAVAALYAAALGLAGLPLLGVLAVAALVARRRPASTPVADPVPWPWLLALAVVVLARPWVPTLWDEFVWLAKARFEALGFGAGVRAALDPSQHLIPPGYPPLWPSAVGWLTLGEDSLQAQVLGSSLLLLLAAGTALEGLGAARQELPGPLRPARAATGLVLALAAPYVWVHWRSCYVDLPVGLLSLALLANLLVPSRLLLATVLALVLAASKDEGLAHVLAAAAAAGLVRRSWDALLPAAAGITASVAWRWLAASHGVSSVDHALGTPAWSWLPTVGRLLLLHASDVETWGVFWALVVAALLRGGTSPLGRALRGLLCVSGGLLIGALLVGPERVRVFAENGTMLNRLLLQLWPAAAVLVWLSVEELAGVPRAPGDAARTPPEPLGR